MEIRSTTISGQEITNVVEKAILSETDPEIKSKLCGIALGLKTLRTAEEGDKTSGRISRYGSKLTSLDLMSPFLNEIFHDGSPERKLYAIETIEKIISP